MQLQPGGPAIGDMRISYQIASLPEDHTLSIIGVRTGATLRPFVEADASRILGKVLTPRSSSGGSAAANADGVDAEAAALEAQITANQIDPAECERANCCRKAALTCHIMVNLVAPLVHFLIGKIIGTDVLLLAPGSVTREKMYAAQEWKVLLSI